MARSLRIERPGAWYHITARGNERRTIFRDERDRAHFCELLGEAVERFGLRLHAWVLMDNHYHLAAGDSGGQSLAGHAVAQRQLHGLVQPAASSAADTCCRAVSRPSSWTRWTGGWNWCCISGGKKCGLKWKELGAAAGGIDYVSASTAVRRLEQRLGKVPALSQALRQAQTRLQKTTMNHE